MDLSLHAFVHSRQRPGDDRQVKRWLVLTLGLGMAAIAGLALLTGVGMDAGKPSSPASSVHHDDIDDASRDQLRAILKQADAEGASTP